ncbi:MAG: MAPEG family protein [Candidatus Thiodiazotropha sp. DIVDIV]
MNQSLILFPLISLVLITGGMGIATLTARYKAVREGSLSIAYFKFNRGGKPPEYLLKISHHFHNLLETPPLYYLSLVVILILGKVDAIYLGLAWLYVVSRIAHAWIHLGSNNILHRKNAFILSYMLIFSIWIRLLIQLIQT